MKMLITYLILFAGVCALFPSTLTTTGTCLRNGPTSFMTQKAENGSVLCATSPPTKTVIADVKLLCVDACLRRPSCGDGFNYRSETKRCELYFDQPNNYQVQPNCSYIKARCCLYCL